jgi:hypothetical protein
VKKSFALSIILSLLLTQQSIAQEQKEWDNQIYFINKVGWGKNDWKFSGELQTRLENNLSSLQSYHVELIASYLPSNTIEIMPDFRYIVLPTRVEYRPGFGIFFKQHFNNARLVHQLKGQYDFESTGYDSFSIRYGLFYHQNLSKSFLTTVFGGGMYEVGEQFAGWWAFVSEQI